MNIEDLVTVQKEAHLDGSTLIVGWYDDGGKLGPTVTEYLIDKLGAEEFASIEPSEFFPLNGVTVDNNIARIRRRRVSLFSSSSFQGLLR